MPYLTFDAIRENPRNVLVLPLLPNASKLLHAMAWVAANYVSQIEYTLMEATRRGAYAPHGWRPSEGGPDIHEECEAYWFDAMVRAETIADAYRERYGEDITAFASGDALLLPLFRL